VRHRFPIEEKSVIQRRAMVAVFVAATGSSLAGCGFQAPAVTDDEHASVQSANLDVGSVRVRDLSVTTEPGKAAGTYITATLINTSQQPETLTKIDTAAGIVTISGSGVFNGGLTLPPKGVPVILTQPALNAAGPTAAVAAQTPPGLGGYVPVQFTFANNGSSVSEQAPVVPPRQTSAAYRPVPATIATPPAEDGQLAND
jgi:hypothetical protein